MTYKQFAVTIAKKAGSIIRSNFKLGMHRKLKKDGSPVTKTDLAVNALVIREVKKHFPDHSVISEEGSYMLKGSQYAWVCDPVDGTIPFSRGVPTGMFSLGLVREGESVLGVAYDPFLDRMFFAQKNGGAFLNGKKMKVSRHNKLKGAYIAHASWYSMPFPMPGFLDEIVFKEKSENFSTGSIVYNSMLVSAGELEGAVFSSDTVFDVAALKVIVEEAGGKVTDLSGKDQRYDRPVKGCLITNGYIHKDLLKVIQKYLK